MRQVADACGHYVRGVPEGHKCDARIVLVEDQANHDDWEAGVPFAGTVGWKLQQFLKAAGVQRRDLYLMVYSDELGNRITRHLTDPYVIVPTGSLALTATTAIQARSWHEDLIGKWRGSILSGCVANNRAKVIPTLHPAQALKEPVLDKTCLFDWARIANEAKTKELKLPKRKLVVMPSVAERKDYLDFLHTYPGWAFSFDIETNPPEGQIVCIGFAYDKSYAIAVTFSEHYDFIQQVLALPNPKVGNNFLYDAYWLAQVGVPVVNLHGDVGSMFHCFDPNAGPAGASKDLEDPNAAKSHIKPYSLAYLASILTRQRYYKEQGRDEEGRFMVVGNDRSKLHQLMEYCCLDNCVQLECYEVLHNWLVKAGKWEFYENHYKAMFSPILRTMLHGVRMDVHRAEQDAKHYQETCNTLKAEVNAIAGMPLCSVKLYKRQPKDWDAANPEFFDSERFFDSEKALKIFGTPWVRLTGKSISNDKLRAYLYNVLKLPGRKRKGKLMADEAALVSLRLNYPQKCGELVDKVLAFRKAEKLCQFLAKGKADADGRVRCQYKNLLLTGRLSSTENPKGTGLNLQNQPPEVRDYYVPDVVIVEDGQVRYE